MLQNSDASKIQQLPKVRIWSWRGIRSVALRGAVEDGGRGAGGEIFCFEVGPAEVSAPCTKTVTVSSLATSG